MADAGFMSMGAAITPVQAQLKNGQMRVGSAGSAEKPIPTAPDPKKGKPGADRLRDKGGKKTDPKEDEKHVVVITEEILKEHPELVEQGLKVGDEMPVEDGEPALPTVEELEAMHIAKVKSLAVKRGYKGEKLDKKSLIEFLTQ